MMFPMITAGASENGTEHNGKTWFELALSDECLVHFIIMIIPAALSWCTSSIWMVVRFIIIRATLSDVPFSMTAKCKLPIDWCTFSCSFLIAILFSLSLLCHKSGRVLFNGMIFFFVELNSYKSYISLSSEQHDLNWCTESPEERSHTWASWRHTWCPHFHPP